MALRKSKELPSGLVMEYCKIESVQVFKNKVSVNTVYFKDLACRLEGKVPVESQWLPEMACVLSEMDAKNPIAFAYEKIKELPEFEGAEDC